MLQTLLYFPNKPYSKWPSTSYTAQKCGHKKYWSVLQGALQPRLDLAITMAAGAKEYRACSCISNIQYPPSFGNYAPDYKDFHGFRLRF